MGPCNPPHPFALARHDFNAVRLVRIKNAPRADFSIAAPLALPHRYRARARVSLSERRHSAGPGLPCVPRRSLPSRTRVFVTSRRISVSERPSRLA